MKHPQLTDELQEQASLYAAGAMTESERREYARHLEEDDCTVCRREAREFQAATALLASRPPERITGRVRAIAAAIVQSIGRPVPPRATGSCASSSTVAFAGTAAAVPHAV